MNLEDQHDFDHLCEFGRRLLKGKQGGGDERVRLTPGDLRIPKKLRDAFEAVLDRGQRLIARNEELDPEQLCEALIQRGADVAMAEAAVNVLRFAPVDTQDPMLLALRKAAGMLIDGRGRPASRAELASLGMPADVIDGLVRAIKRAIVLLKGGAELVEALNQLTGEGVQATIALAAAMEVHAALRARAGKKVRPRPGPLGDFACRLLQSKQPGPGPEGRPRPEPDGAGIPSKTRRALDAALDRGMELLSEDRTLAPQRLSARLVEDGVELDVAEAAAHAIMFAELDDPKPEGADLAAALRDATGRLILGRGGAAVRAELVSRGMPADIVGDLARAIERAFLLLKAGKEPRRVHERLVSREGFHDRVAQAAVVGVAEVLTAHAELRA